MIYNVFSYSFLKKRVQIIKVVEAPISLPEFDLVSRFGLFGDVYDVNSIRRLDVITSSSRGYNRRQSNVAFLAT